MIIAGIYASYEHEPPTTNYRHIHLLGIPVVTCVWEQFTANLTSDVKNVKFHVLKTSIEFTYKKENHQWTQLVKCLNFSQ